MAAVAAASSSATIDVTFDEQTCVVTISSSKGVSNYVIRDAHGSETKTELTDETSTVMIQLAPGETITVVSVKSGRTEVGPFGPFTCLDTHDGHDGGH